MKTIVFILSSSLGLLLAGCMKDHTDNQLSQAQLKAVAEMKSAYQVAKVYNDSLMMCYSDSIAHPASMKHYYDYMYHQYDLLFENCHSGYEHNYVSANHSHNGQGMVEMHASHGGNMMMGGGGCQCCDNGGHGAELHDQLNALHQLHIPYHPN